MSMLNTSFGARLPKNKSAKFTQNPPTKIMQLTRYTDYSLRVLVFLCSRPDGDSATAGEIADYYGISRNHIAKVVSMLAEADLVTTSRGRGGGLRLAVAPEDICIGELVRATENLTLVECFDRDHNTCPLGGDCTLEVLLHQATNAFLAVLDKTTLAQLLPASSALVSLRKHLK